VTNFDLRATNFARPMHGAPRIETTFAELLLASS